MGERGTGKGAWSSKKLTAAVEGHAARPRRVVLLDALLVDGLLGDDVAGAEEHGGGDGLREEGPAGQPGLVPVGLEQVRGQHRRVEEIPW